MQTRNIVRAALVATCLLLAACGGEAAADAQSSSKDSGKSSGKVVGCEAFKGIDFTSVLGAPLKVVPPQRTPEPNEAGYTACVLEGDTSLVQLQIWESGGDEYYAQFVDGRETQPIAGLGKRAVKVNASVYATSGDKLMALNIAHFASDLPGDARADVARKVYANLGW